MIDTDQCFLHDVCKIYQKGECHPHEFCLKLFKTDALYNAGLFTTQQRTHQTLYTDQDGTDRDQFGQLKYIEKNVEQFVSEGSNLYLYSPHCGNGKTSWALRIAQSFVNRIWHKTDIRCRLLFISVPRFFTMIKDNIRTPSEYVKHIKDNVYDCDLVIWDDIGTKIGTEFEIENLLTILDYRISNHKSNIFTSNMSPEDLNVRVGERLYSRIVNTSYNIQLMGKDKRGMKV